MKISKKILIPVFATAMGLSVVGGISGAVAWYQYNTKVQASFMGVTTADGGVLQIKKVEDGAKWGRFANYGSASSKLHPVTFGAMADGAALPSKAYKHPHAGVQAMTSWDEAAQGTDYYQMKFQLQALKLDPAQDDYVAVEAPVHLEELILDSATAGADVANAIRVHISTSAGNKLYSKAGGTTVTHGNLDLDKDGEDDIIGGYGWDYNNNKIDYGDNGSQVANQLVANTTASDSNLLFTVPEAGLEVTITIWLEGWEKLHDPASAIWDVAQDEGVEIHFGMKLFTPKTTFDVE